jgi:hypothetical protein
MILFKCNNIVILNLIIFYLNWIQHVNSYKYIQHFEISQHYIELSTGLVYTSHVRTYLSLIYDSYKKLSINKLDSGNSHGRTKGELAQYNSLTLTNKHNTNSSFKLAQYNSKHKQMTTLIHLELYNMQNEKCIYANQALSFLGQIVSKGLSHTHTPLVDYS